MQMSLLVELDSKSHGIWDGGVHCWAMDTCTVVGLQGSHAEGAGAVTGIKDTGFQRQRRLFFFSLLSAVHNGIEPSQKLMKAPAVVLFLVSFELCPP
jgi:hypothetical protein